MSLKVRCAGNLIAYDSILAYTGNWSKDSLFGHKKDDAQQSTAFNMQKSKSSTNVGQVFAKKIWKSRSKSQTRPDSPAQPRWTPQVCIGPHALIPSTSFTSTITKTHLPTSDSHHRHKFISELVKLMRCRLSNLISLQGNCIWKTASGKYLHLKRSNLHELNEVERKNLQQIALNRINQLNIGVPIKLPSGEFLNAHT